MYVIVAHILTQAKFHFVSELATGNAGTISLVSSPKTAAWWSPNNTEYVSIINNGEESAVCGFGLLMAKLLLIFYDNNNTICILLLYFIIALVIAIIIIDNANTPCNFRATRPTPWIGGCLKRHARTHHTNNSYQ